MDGGQDATFLFQMLKDQLNYLSKWGGSYRAPGIHDHTGNFLSIDNNSHSTVNFDNDVYNSRSKDNINIHLSKGDNRDNSCNCSINFLQNSTTTTVTCKGSVKANFNNLNFNSNISNFNVSLPDSFGRYCMEDSLREHEIKLQAAVNDLRLGHSHYRSNINNQIFHLSHMERGESSWMSELVNTPSSAKQIPDLRSNKDSSANSCLRVEKEVKTTHLNDFHFISEHHGIKGTESKYWKPP